MFSTQRFRPRHGVTVLATDDGAIVAGPTASLELKSRAIGTVLGWLWPRLDGTRAVADLANELPDESRQAVAGLLARLHAKGMLLAVATEDPERLAALTALYPEQMAYLATRVKAPLAAFERFRQASFAVRGEGVVLRNVAAALAHYGALSVTFAAPAADSALATLLADANDRDCARRFTQGEVGDADVLIDAGSVFSEPVVAERRGDRPLARRAGIYVHGPLLDVAVQTTPQQDQPRFRVGVDREDSASRAIAPAAAAMAAHHCVAALFDDLAGIALPAPPSLIQIDQDRLTSTVVRHAPSGGRAGDGDTPRRAALHASIVAASETSEFPRPDIPDGAAVTTATYDAIHHAATALIDSVAGPLVALGEGGLEQVPYARSAAEIRLGDDVEHVICAALSAREARNQAVLFAAERWAEAVPGLVRSGSTVGAGWSQAEAAYRAMCRRSSLVVPTREERRAAGLRELAGLGRIVAHLAELGRALGLSARGDAVALVPAAEGGWLAWPTEAAATTGFGATPAQAAANMLFRALIERAALHDVVPAALIADATAADIAALIAAASARIDFTALDWPGQSGDPAAPVRLHLIEAKGRAM